MLGILQLVRFWDWGIFLFYVYDAVQRITFGGISYFRLIEVNRVRFISILWFFFYVVAGVMAGRWALGLFFMVRGCIYR